LIVEQFSSLEVKKKLQTPLLRERIEHLTQSVKSVLGEGLSRRVCHTVLDTVSHGFAVEEFSSLEVEKKLQCHTALDAVSLGFAVEQFSSLEVEKKYSTPTPTLPLGEGVFRHCERSEAIQLFNTVSHGPGVQDLFTLAIADRSIYPVRNDLF